MSKHKILTPEKLAEVCRSLQKSGKKVAQCHGCFDLVHLGHIKHFEAAKKFGDVLIVSITEDKHVNKGPGRPVFGEQQRAEALAALAVVDYVTISRAATAVPLLELLRPDFYVKGQDYKNFNEDVTGEIANEKAAVERHGGQLVFTEEIRFSSSSLINSALSGNEENLDHYLKTIRERVPFKSLEALFTSIQDYTVLVVGDVILDEYQFVEPLGMASKSNTIAVRLLESELHAGGVLAVVNHIADFVKKVVLVTSYGQNAGGNYYEFIRAHLRPNVELKAFHTADRATTLKKRFIDRTFRQKIFESVEIATSPLAPADQAACLELLRAVCCDRVDLAVVADFGHGLVDAGLIDFISKQKTFLAVNAQTNSANRGFNLLTKYPRCDYFSIDREEARLATHDKEGDIRQIHLRLMAATQATYGAITLGVEGSLVRHRDQEGFAHAPVLSREIVDTTGAGDAFLSVTALLARAGATPDQMALVGNAVGAMAVKILGNKSSIKKIPLLKYIKTLLA
jgi:rfaE bifunctional protein nucleotidyltransferase chain/domain